MDAPGGQTVRELTAISPRALYTGAAPVPDEKYRRWIRSFPCLVCGRRFGIEAAHTGPHGLKQKSPDTSCLPFCKAHHAELHRGIRAFAERHRLELPCLVEQFNELWNERRAA